jgi:phosphatidylserine/phosphatidylglycerophosphate/cardiolipin synthase-like enzyme
MERDRKKLGTAREAKGLQESRPGQLRNVDLPSFPLLTYAIHEKILVVDGTWAVVGGRNLEDKYFTHWDDLDLYVEGPVVREIQAGFVRSWESFCRNIRQEMTPARISGEPEPAGTSAVRFVQSRPWLGEYNTLEMLVTAFQMAGERICVSSQYLVLPESLLRASLLDAARRGVEVLILTNSYTTGLEVGFSVGHFVTLRYCEPLIEAGIRVYEMIGPEAEDVPKPYMHAKQFVVDGKWAAVGSFNLSMRSCFIESENLVVVQDPAFARAQETMFRHKIERHATEMTRDRLMEHKEKYRTKMAMTNYLDLFF